MNSIVALPIAAAVPLGTLSIADSDAELLSVASEILRLNELANQDKDEMVRLQGIWREKLDQLLDQGKHTPKERWAIVCAMPESIEHSRLVNNTEPCFAAADKLVKRLWSLPAQTPDGKKAKVRVLFDYILDSDWHCSDKDADWDIEMTRKLLFELAGTSTAEILGKSPIEILDIVPTTATSPDPIFAAIEAHRTAWGALGHDCSALAELARDSEEAQQKLDALHDAVSEAEDGLLDVIPTTFAGVVAILSYAADHVRRGSEWGGGYVDEEPLSGWCEKHGVPWEVILHQNLAKALHRMA
jgi:hypothetical protein